MRKIWRNAAPRSSSSGASNRPRSRCRRSWSVVSGVRSSCAATVRKFSRTTRASSAARRARSLAWQRMLKPTPMARNTAVAMTAGSDSDATPGGSRKTTFTIAAPETVQTSPGKSPPYQALMKLAPWKSMNGTSSSDGRRAACSAAAPPSEAATTAQDRMRARASLMPRHHGCDHPPVNGCWPSPSSLGVRSSGCLASDSDDSLLRRSVSRRQEVVAPFVVHQPAADDLASRVDEHRALEVRVLLLHEVVQVPDDSVEVQSPVAARHRIPDRRRTDRDAVVVDGEELAGADVAQQARL